MTNFFEQELWYLFGDGRAIDSPYCSGQSCYGILDKDLRVRIQFIATHISGQYDALKLTVLNRINGPVDTQVVTLKDLLGKKTIRDNPNFRECVTPHIWDDYGKADWYVYHPNSQDYQQLTDAVSDYLEVFQEQAQTADPQWQQTM